MRLGVLTNSIAQGGAERQAAIWATLLAEAGHDVGVLSLHRFDVPFNVPASVSMSYADKLNRSSAWRLLPLLRRWAHDRDVVVAFQPYPAVLCWAARLGVPWLLVTGDDPRHHWSDREVTRVPERVFRWAFESAWAASAPTAELVACYEALGIAPRGPWLTIPNIIDDGAFATEPATRAGALFVGRLVPEKDPLLALEAARRAEVPLTFLGSGPLAGELERRAASTPEPVRAGLAGFVAPPWPMYARHRTLLLTSRYETFGNVIVESLATGTPVVSVDCDFGPRALLAGARYSRLVDRDPDALAVALREAVARPYSADEEDECRAIADRYRAAAVAPLLEQAVAATVAAPPRRARSRRARSGSSSGSPGRRPPRPR
jgi:glycosyltransferase involved in cell wall biosynthesis